nr:hypothetical protein [Spirochaetia bacterium]
MLGFSHQLSTVPIKELYKTYSDFIDEARNRTFYGTESTDGRTNFASAQIFSDSIILVSNKVDDVFNVNNFIGAIHFILEIGFKKNFPLRGAISIGNFILDKERDIFLSKCFPKIVKYESKQEWTGCVILEDAKDLIIESIFGKVALKEGVQIQG